MQAKIVVREMAEQLAMDLVEKKLVTDQIVLTVGYDIDNLKIPEIADHYHGEITVDRYGRSVPKHAHGTGNLDAMTASVSRITETTMGLYERIVDPMLLTRRITLVANHLKDADSVKGRAVLRTDGSVLRRLFANGAERNFPGNKAAGKGTAGKRKTLAGSNAQRKIKVWKECDSEGCRSAGGSHNHRQEPSDWRT